MNVAANGRARQRILADVDARSAVNKQRRDRRLTPESVATFTEPEALAHLATSKTWKIVAEVARNEHTPREVRVALSTHWSYAVRGAVAQSLPDLGDLEAAFLRDGAHQVRAGLAARSDLGADTWAMLSRDPYDWVRRQVASNPACPMPVLTNLLMDAVVSVSQAAFLSGRFDDAALLSALAQKPGLDLALSRTRRAYSETVLIAFTRSQNKWVRCNVVDRSDCPASVLAVLADDEDTDVRGRVAKHPNTNEATLTRLMLGRARSVHELLARREGGAEFITEHADPKVRLKGVAVLVPHSPFYARLLADADPAVRAAAVHVRLDDSEFDRLAEDGDKRVRAQVARCAHHASVLALLASDPEWTVRLQVARNRLTPAEVLAGLGSDPAVKVRQEAASSFLSALAQ